MSAAVVSLAGCRFRRLSKALLGHDYAEAFRLAHPLALEGDPRAQGVVGALHFSGEGGCALDLVEAWAWLHRAECGGNARARELLDLVEPKLSADDLAAAGQRALSILLAVQGRCWGLEDQRRRLREEGVDVNA
jgi:TPR repeat protein